MTAGRTKTLAPGAAWRRSAKGRVAHGIVAGVWAAANAVLVAFAASDTINDPESAVLAGRWLVAVGAAGVVTGLALAVVNGCALRAGAVRYAALRNWVGVVGLAVTALVITVLVLATLGSAAPWVVPMAGFLIVSLVYQLVVAGATVAALGRDRVPIPTA